MTIRELVKHIYPAYKVVICMVYGENKPTAVEAPTTAGTIAMSGDSFYDVKVVDWTLYESYLKIIV